MEKEAKNKAVKAPLTDSEGTPVVSIKDETVKEEESLNRAAKKALEEEMAEDEAEAVARAKAAAAHDPYWQNYL